MDGDAAEKMEALKRAYAAIILNTAKEATARVLAADRRAAQSERCLSMAKEESLALLLRVKAVMDNKIKEAEKVKLLQARKIHGLQMKLREAEDTIGTLRSQLKRVHSKIENTNSNQAKGGVTFTPNVDMKCDASSQDKDDHYCFMKGPLQADSSKCLIISNDCAKKPDLASIILTNKEQEPYRNGCTQRIHAFEHNLLARRLHHAVSDEQFPKIDDKTVECENGMMGRSASEICLLTDKTSQVKASLDSEKVGCPGYINGKDYVLKICTWRRRRRMRRKGIMKPRSFGTLNDMTVTELINDNHSIASEISDIAKSVEAMHARTCEVSHETPNYYLSQKSTEDVKTSKGICIELKEPISRQTPGRSNGQTVTESSKTCLKDHFGIKQEAKGEKVVNHARLNRDCNTLKEVIYSQKENHVTDIFLEKGESKDDKPCSTSTLPAEAPVDRIVKYRRKRKRASLEAKKENVSLEENDSTRRKFDPEDHLIKPQKMSTVIDSSSRDSRRLVQVARQLISLSEKKWW